MLGESLQSAASSTRRWFVGGLWFLLHLGSEVITWQCKLWKLLPAGGSTQGPGQVTLAVSLLPSNEALEIATERYGCSEYFIKRYSYFAIVFPKLSQNRYCVLLSHNVYEDTWQTNLSISWSGVDWWSALVWRGIRSYEWRLILGGGRKPSTATLRRKPCVIIVNYSYNVRQAGKPPSKHPSLQAYVLRGICIHTCRIDLYICEHW